MCTKIFYHVVSLKKHYRKKHTAEDAATESHFKDVPSLGQKRPRTEETQTWAETEVCNTDFGGQVVLAKIDESSTD